MAGERKKGLWQGLRDSVEDASQKYQANAAETAAKGMVDSTTTLTIYKDGTFATSQLGFGKSSRDRLLALEHDIDSMRRKSASGRGAAALLTGGASLIASNNRGVVYVTVTGEETGVRTYTTRNPSGTVLSTIRSLKAAADAVVAQASSPVTPAATTDVAAQLGRLAELHASGALSDEEFAAAKARLLA